jgi:hypothetical protein
VAASDAPDVHAAPDQRQVSELFRRLQTGIELRVIGHNSLWGAGLPPSAMTDHPTLKLYYGQDPRETIFWIALPIEMAFRTRLT